ncbi:MAG: rod shape-determining protein MreD [Candidatus Brocadia sp.]|nr:rod shape-determining protein MreD [Candidatus Brocadia sp.]MDG6025670.1 rod shape-determining protein MreD [Candidatus Brocadia sp.]
MRWFTFFCMLFCISLFQSTLMYWINLGTAAPDLYFPFVVFYAFLTDVKRNTVANWLTGMSKDLFSEGSFGMNSVLFVAIGFFLWSSREILFRGHLVTQILITFIFSVIYNIIYTIHVEISFHSLCFSSTLRMIFCSSFYTAMVVPVLFWIFNRFQPTHKLFFIKGN